MFPTPEIDDIRLMPEIPRWKKIGFALVLLFLAAYLFWLWLRPAPHRPGAGFVAAAPSAQVAGLSTQKIQPAAGIKVLPKKETVRRLNLPAEIGNDQSAEVLTAVDMPPTDGGITAVPILNTSTGETTVAWKEKPRPFFSFESGTEIGGRYGVRTDAIQEADIYLRRDLARIGSTYISGYLEASAHMSVDPRPEAKAMIEVSYRWK